MESSYLIDTNVAIDLVTNRLPEQGRTWVDTLIVDNKAATSVINRMELLGFTGPESELQVLGELLQVIPVLQLSENVILQTIEVRKQYRIKLPDAIIAATAIVHGLTLVSRNRKDFARIEGLEFIDPYAAVG